MKLTEKIKEKIDNAKSEEEVNTILENVREEAEDAGLILDEEELDTKKLSSEDTDRRTFLHIYPKGV